MHPKVFPPSKKKRILSYAMPGAPFNARSCELQRKKEKLRPADNPQIHPLFKLRKENKKNPLGEFRQAGYYCHKGNSNPRLQIISLYKTNKSNKSIAGKGGRAAHYRQMPRALSQILLGELSDVSGLQGSGYDIPRKRILDFFVDYTL